MTNLSRVAAELNNVGVLLHKTNQRREASKYYYEALCAITDYLREQTHMHTSHNTMSDGYTSPSPLHSLFNVNVLEELHPGMFFRVDSNDKRINSVAREQHLLPTSIFEPIMAEDPNSPSDTHVRPQKAKVTSVIILYNLGLLSIQVGTLQNLAENLFDMAMMIRSDISEQDLMVDAITVCIQVNLGFIQYQLGNEDHAMLILMEALQFGHETLGQNNILRISILGTIGQVLASMGLFGDAILAFDEASRIYDRMTLEIMAGNSMRAGDDKATAPAA